MDELLKTSRDVYSIATKQVLEYLTRGIVPWLNSWTAAGIPQNLITRKEYRDINIFLLSIPNFSKNFYVTPKQVSDFGWSVRENEKAIPVFYWKFSENKDAHPNGNVSPILRYSYLYNYSQCRGINKSKIPKVKRPRFPLEMCASVSCNMPKPPRIITGKLPATYMSTLDCIEIPRRHDYPNEELYYATLFRCLIHSTGHESRLNRKEVMNATVSDHKYHATEFLIGEIGASHLASLAGIRYGLRGDMTSYCRDWITRLQKDPRLIIYASNQAQRAVDYILNCKK